MLGTYNGNEGLFPSNYTNLPSRPQSLSEEPTNIVGEAYDGGEYNAGVRQLSGSPIGGADAASLQQVNFGSDGSLQPAPVAAVPRKRPASASSTGRPAAPSPSESASAALPRSASAVTIDTIKESELNTLREALGQTQRLLDSQKRTTDALRLSSSMMMMMSCVMI